MSGSEEDGDTGFAVRWPSVQKVKRDLAETQPQKKAERSEQPDRPARIGQPEEEPQERKKTGRKTGKVFHRKNLCRI